MTDPIDRAITLFEHGRIEEAAHVLTVVRRSAVDAEEERLTEIDDVIGQMEAHLSGHAREAFDRAVADESASTEPHRALRRGELRSIVQSVGVVASAGVVAILVSALFRWPHTLLYALLVAVAGPVLIASLAADRVRELTSAANEPPSRTEGASRSFVAARSSRYRILVFRPSREVLDQPRGWVPPRLPLPTGALRVSDAAHRALCGVSVLRSSGTRDLPLAVALLV